jgi:hypothetical protein
MAVAKSGNAKDPMRRVAGWRVNSSAVLEANGCSQPALQGKWQACLVGGMIGVLRYFLGSRESFLNNPSGPIVLQVQVPW